MHKSVCLCRKTCVPACAEGLPLHDVTHTLVVHSLLTAVVQNSIKFERIIFSHVVDDAHGRIFLHIAVDRSRFGSHNQLVVSKVGCRSRANAHAYSRSHHHATLLTKTGKPFPQADAWEKPLLESRLAMKDTLSHSVCKVFLVVRGLKQAAPIQLSQTHCQLRFGVPSLRRP
jgi:hypothetical protein